MSPQPTQIRSFRVCFKLERRLHKIDNWRIPVPFGVPLAGIGYAVGAFLALLLLARLPILGSLIGILPAPLRFVILPVGIAWALTRWQIDGRPAQASVTAWARLKLGPARVAAFRPAAPLGPVTLGSVAIAGDGRGARWRPAVVTGPAQVILRYPIRTREGRRTLEIWREAGPPRFRGVQVALEPGQRAVIR